MEDGREEPVAPQQRRRICRLALSTADRLRSAVVVPTLPQVLAELVQNSLDAQARSVYCSVDLDTWTIRCDDSGPGFAPQDLDLLARAERNTTSKVPLLDEADEHSQENLQGGAEGALESLESYGFRGEALASLQHLATLEIRSRLSTDPLGRTHELVMRGGACLARGETAVERPNHGATVMVRDIFHNLPVRRRALEKPSARASVLTSLRATLASLALVHPAVAFSLVDTSSTSTASVASLVGSQGKTLLSVRPSPNHSIVARWKQLWGPLGVDAVGEFCETETLSVRNTEESDSDEACQARGFFSLAPAHSKAQQYIYVNHRPLSASQSPLHKRVNALFATSSFARHASSALPATSPSCTDPAATRRASERHPIFVLALEVPGRIVDVSLEPEKSVVEFEDPARVERFVVGIVTRFLVQHGFLQSAPQNTVSTIEGAVAPSAPPKMQSPRKRSHQRDAAPDDSGSVAEDIAPPRAKRTALASNRSQLSEGPLVRKSANGHTPATASGNAPCPDGPQPERTDPPDGEGAAEPQRTLWTDPVTRVVWEVDLRTGNSRRYVPRSAANRDEQNQGDDEGDDERIEPAYGIVDRTALKSGNRDGEMPAWLAKSLKDWRNPIFPTAAPEATIPKLPTLPTALQLVQAPLTDSFPASKRSRQQQASTKTISEFCGTANAFTVPSHACSLRSDTSGSPAMSRLRLSTPAPASPSATQTFSREALAAAEFVAQIDHKYLLVKLPHLPDNQSEPTGSDRSTLVLVDQHAASERVRIERFLEATAGAVARGDSTASRQLESTTTDAGPPTASSRIGVLVSSSEYELVSRYPAVFARWGFTLACDAAPVDHSGSEARRDIHQIWLTAVPELVADRLLREEGLAQDLVRSFVAHLEQHGPGRAGTAVEARNPPSENEAGWTSAVKDAPPVLVDLLNSKACRGAIMFNDELTKSQAEALLAKLAKTVYPFQCAHGRPSLVPLVNLAPASASTYHQARGPAAGAVDWQRFA